MLDACGLVFKRFVVITYVNLYYFTDSQSVGDENVVKSFTSASFPRRDRQLSVTNVSQPRPIAVVGTSSGALPHDYS